MYGGQCFGEFASSLLDLQDRVIASGGGLTRIFQGNESLVTRGRDTIAHLFLTKTSATHLLFADADLKFRADDVLRMMASDESIVCGPVAMKGINWQAVGNAARHGDPNFRAHAAMWSVKGGTVAGSNGLIEIEHAGGFILIRRDVFEKMADATASYRGHGSVEGQTVRHYFATEIRDGEFLSEDYAFCRRWRDAGGKVWLAPWCEIKHFGTYAFGAS